ncbi:unnamed protein product [Rhizophagus irregularis]|nr:unnamed protein product [Rhizophagus irregularis]
MFQEHRRDTCYHRHKSKRQERSREIEKTQLIRKSHPFSFLVTPALSRFGLQFVELLLTLKTLHITHMIHYHNRKDSQVDGLLKENLKKRGASPADNESNFILCSIT